ncbi:MAG TPA: 5-oxoprolinase subunit PxpB [Pyrinomonadaceae bacterium]|jgi:KipI family sensor histidine kinase inhibitor
MDQPTPRISSLGESAVVVDFGRVISEDLNQQATGLAEYLVENPFDGFIEAVPAYTSTTVFFDPSKMCAAGVGSAYETVAGEITTAVSRATKAEGVSKIAIEIPSKFDSASGPDLEIVAGQSGMSVDGVIELFISSVYRVFMIGFLPGFAYMGEVDGRIAIPRKQQPRQLVPKGSIGIAGRQTGIYPLDSPGGWQLIGRTDVALFTPKADRPTLFQPGDLVRFVPT